ncbi:MAG TPA: pyridoxamine 5'-phosphate oxidase family protein [Streptosporangiaceae bacterium]|nr:pyridoxamine 5'-phosphate oxidase family protein [Streptosporangiaceae bacterium]
MSTPRRRLTQLSGAESIRLLSTVPLGRIAFTHRALPAIRTVSHLVEDGDIIIRSHHGSPVISTASLARGVVVAYEAGDIDADAYLGWTVTVTGTARLVDDLREGSRYQQELEPWTTAEEGEVIRIHPGIVSGYRLDPILGGPPGL